MVVVYKFTYKDYINYIHTIKREKYLNINDESEKYELVKKDNPIEHIIECLFKDEKRIRKMINIFIMSKNAYIKEELEYINFHKNINKLEIIYKHKYREIFYLIKYIPKINANLPYDIFKKCVQILSMCNKDKIEKTIIVPIVICLENNIYNHKKEKKLKTVTRDKNIINLRYNLININKSHKIENTILEELIYLETFHVCFA